MVADWPKSRNMLTKKLLYSAYRLSTRHLAPDGSLKVVHGTCFHVNSADWLFLVTSRHNVELSYKDQKYVGYRWDGMQIDGYCNDDDYFQFSFAGHTVSYARPDNPAEDVVVVELPKEPVQFRRRRKPGEDPNKRTEKFAPVVL